jgi:hypothetical protein
LEFRVGSQITSTVSPAMRDAATPRRLEVEGPARTHKEEFNADLLAFVKR